MFTKNIFFGLIFLISIILFNGCGGGVSGSNSSINNSSSSNQDNSVLTGYFIDAPVYGLKYKTESFEGYTSSDGSFSYYAGESVEFFLGNLSFGKVTAQDIITPYTLAGDTDIYNPSVKAANIARILQSLDDTSTNSDLITLPRSLHNMNISDIDLSDTSDTPFSNILIKAQVQTSKSYTLKTKDASVNVMINYIVQNNISIVKAEDKSSQKLPTTLEELKGNKYYMVMDRRAYDNPALQQSLIPTGNVLDLAIQGEYFFKLLKPNGTYVYTRDGQFKINADGDIVHSTGYILQPNIILPSGTTNLSIAHDGTIAANLGGVTTLLGQIKLYTFPNPLGLNKIDKDIFISTLLSGKAVSVNIPDSALQQGMIESSHVRGMVKATILFDEYTNKRVSSGIFTTLSENYTINGSTGYFEYDTDSWTAFSPFDLYPNQNMEIYQVTNDYTELHIKDGNGNIIRKEYFFIDNQKRDAFYNKLRYTTTTTLTHDGLEYGAIISPYTGKTWLDRNLGASRVCTSIDDKECFGDYYQWGRQADGHEKKDSDHYQDIVNTLIPNTDKFFASGSNDWTTVDNNGSIRQNIWNPCPSGYKIPTYQEVRDEIESAEYSNASKLFTSFLKIPLAGYRSYFYGTIDNNSNFIWTSSPSVSNNSLSFSLAFDESSVNHTSYSFSRADGHNVRCIKDDDYNITNQFIAISSPSDATDIYYTTDMDFHIGDDGLLKTKDGYNVMGIAPTVSGDKFSSNHTYNFVETVFIDNNTSIGTINWLATDFTQTAVSTGVSGDNYKSVQSNVNYTEILGTQYYYPLDDYYNGTTIEEDVTYEQHKITFPLNTTSNQYDLSINISPTGNITQSFDTNIETTLKKFSDKISNNNYVISSVDITTGILTINNLIPTIAPSVSNAKVNGNSITITQTQSKAGSGKKLIDTYYSKLDYLVTAMGGDFAQNMTLIEKPTQNQTINLSTITTNLNTLGLDENTTGIMNIQSGTVYVSTQKAYFAVGYMPFFKFNEPTKLQNIGNSKYKSTTQSGSANLLK